MKILFFSLAHLAAWAIFLFTSVVPLYAQTSATKTCKAVLLMEYSSGQILYEEKGFHPQRTASLAKVMTAYLVFKKEQAGVVSFDEVVTASARASRVGGSSVYLKHNEQFTMWEMLGALLIRSANDVAAAIAEHVGGDVDSFVDLMNKQAQRLGLTETEFSSPHGLPPSGGGRPDMASPRDIAILSRALLNDFPLALELTAIADLGFRNNTFQMRSSNHLLRNYDGCDGVKTGFYRLAGFSVSASAVRDGMRLFAVVMGCAQRQERDKEAARLLDMGFDTYRLVPLMERGYIIEPLAWVEGGEDDAVALLTTDSLHVVLPHGDEERVESTVEMCAVLTAPVVRGVPCGVVTFSLDGQELGRVGLVTADDIVQMGWRERLRKRAGL